MIIRALKLKTRLTSSCYTAFNYDYQGNEGTLKKLEKIKIKVKPNRSKCANMNAPKLSIKVDEVASLTSVNSNPEL